MSTMEEFDHNVSIKEEEPDFLGDTSAQIHPSQNQIVFSFKTDDDDVTVVKTEPDQDDEPSDCVETKTEGILNSLKEVGTSTLEDQEETGEDILTTLSQLAKKEIEDGVPAQRSGFLDEFQPVRGVDEKGNNVVILRLPKREKKTLKRESFHKSLMVKPSVRGLRPCILTAHTIDDESSVEGTEPEAKIPKNEDPSVVQSLPKSKPCSNIFKCLFCGRKFAQIVRYKHHMETHSEKGPILCVKCDEGFFFNSSHTEHFEKEHRKRIAYFCSTCKKYVWRGNVQEHLFIHRRLRKQFSCRICGNMFKNVPELFEHVKEHETLIPVKCGVCKKDFVNFESLEPHLKEHFEEGQYKCKMCGKKLKTAVEFSEHCKSHVGILPFECERCNMKFRNRLEFTHHNNRCPEKVRKLKCDQCLEKVNTVHELKLHKDSCHRNFTCNFCCVRYYRKEDLVTHLKTHKVVAHFL